MNGTRLNIPGTEIVALVESAIRKPDPEQMNTVRRCVNWFLQQVKPPTPNIANEMPKSP